MSAAVVRIDADFDLGRFLEQPLTAHVAVAGPSVRPVWFLWEDGAFWWLTGDWPSLTATLKNDPRVALVVDTCHPETGTVLQVSADGDAEIYQLDRERARRLLRRYLGPEEARWPARLVELGFHDPATRLIRLEPARLRARTLSYEAP